jgi:hypothetical protein
MTERAVCAAALVASAAIHFAVVPEHTHEWMVEAVFFVSLGLVELALAVATITLRSRVLISVGFVASVVTVGLWAVSRTIGLPVGPEHFEPEPIAASDLIATALEVLAAVMFLRLAADAREPAPVHRIRL